MDTMTRVFKPFPEDEYPPELLSLFAKIPAGEYPAELESARRAQSVAQIEATNETPAETIERIVGKLGVRAVLLPGPCEQVASPLPQANAHEVAIATALANLANCKPSHRWYYVKRLREEREKAARAELAQRPGDIEISVNPDGTVGQR